MDNPKDDNDLDFDDDEFLDDDFDDLDSIDDEALLDESLDDIENGLGDSIDIDDLDAVPPSQQAKKSFVATYFNFIVIGVAVVFGGFFLLNVLSNDQPQSNTNSALSQNAPADGGDSLNAAPEEAPAPDSVRVDLAQLRNQKDKQTATLPYEEDINALETNDNQRQNTDSDSILDSIPAPDDLSEEDDFFATLNTDPDPSGIAEDSDAEDMGEDMSDAETTTKNTAEEGVLLPMPDSLGTDVAGIDGISVSPFNGIDAPSADPIPDSSVEPLVNNDRVIELEKTVIDLTAKLDALMQDNKELEQDLTSVAAEKRALQDNLSDLNQKLKDAQRAQKVAQTAAPKETPPPKAPATAPQTAKQVAPTEAKPAASAPQQKPVTLPQTANKAPKSAPVAAKATPRWIMRSAQDGRAVIANQDTGDLLRIAEGDNVTGLGVIQSIRFQNNQWVITGSQKSISR